MIPILSNLNHSLFQDLNSHAGQYPPFDRLMVFCANDLIFLWPLLLLLVWGIPLAWRKNIPSAKEAAQLQERRAVVLWTAIACLLAYALNLLVEQFVFEPRPFISHHVHLLVQHAADASFPSDHTAWSFAVVGMLAFTLLPWSTLSATNSSKIFWLLFTSFIVACLIGIARIFVGVHYPGDILGGAADGLIAAIIVTYLRRWLARPTAAIIQLAQRLRLA